MLQLFAGDVQDFTGRSGVSISFPYLRHVTCRKLPEEVDFKDYSFLITAFPKILLWGRSQQINQREESFLCTVYIVLTINYHFSEVIKVRDRKLVDCLHTQHQGRILQRTVAFGVCYKGLYKCLSVWDFVLQYRFSPLFALIFPFSLPPHPLFFFIK